MQLRRVKVELEYDDVSLTCSHYPDDLEPTLVIVNGQEYEGYISVELEKGTYIVRFTRK